MPDIFLYPWKITPDGVTLSDPSVLRTYAVITPQATAFGSGNSPPETVPLNSTAGDTIILAIALGTTFAITSVSDAGGNSYHMLGAFNSGGTARIELWATDSLSPNASGTITVTQSATSQIQIAAASYRNVGLIGSVGSTGASGSTGSISSGPVPLDDPRAWLVNGLAKNSAGNVTAIAPTVIEKSINVSLWSVIADQGGDASNPATSSFTITANSTWGMVWAQLMPVPVAPVSSFTGTIAEAQAVQAEAAAGLETFSGALAEDQLGQSEAGNALLEFTAIGTESQASQSEAISALETFSGTVAEAQSAQTESGTELEIFSGTVTQSQGIQSEASAGTLQFSSTVSESQTAQSEALNALLLFSGTVSEAQAAQQESASESPSFTGTVDTSQAAQVSLAVGTTQDQIQQQASGGVNIGGHLPRFTYVPPLRPAVSGIVTMRQRRSETAGMGEVRFLPGFMGSAATVQGGAETQAFGENIDVELEMVTAILMEA